VSFKEFNRLSIALLCFRQSVLTQEYITEARQIFGSLARRALLFPK
jgi:hypothetical protein